MKKPRSKVMLFVVVLGLSCLVGCECPSNKEAGFPWIKCQPVDLTVGESNSAMFSVEAAGSGLTYQWHFDGEPILGATNAVLAIPSTVSSNLGLYHCVIEAGVLAGEPKRTRTRDASLGTTNASMSLMMGGTNIMILGEQQPIPPGTVVNGGPCDLYCSYKLFDNAGSLYKATATTCTTTLLRKLPTGTVEYVPVGQYDLFWKKVSTTNSGCATNYSAYQKRFGCVKYSQYKFTVYIKPGYCTNVTLLYTLGVEFP